MTFFDDGYKEDKHTSIVTYVVNGVAMTESEYAQKARDKYIKNPPVGYSSKEIARMSDEDMLDMDYFLNE